MARVIVTEMVYNMIQVIHIRHFWDHIFPMLPLVYHSWLMVAFITFYIKCSIYRMTYESNSDTEFNNYHL